MYRSAAMLDLWLSIFLCGIGNDHRQQLLSACTCRHELAGLVLTTPREDLVGVHSMRARYLRYASARHHRLLNDPALLFNRAPATSGLSGPNTNFRTCNNALLHTGIVYRLITRVQTVGTKRLPKAYLQGVSISA